MSAEKRERLRNGEGKPTGKLGCAYDCGCRLGKTVSRSPLQELALWACLLLMVGLMHGYAHERLCQLLFLMLYIVGTGLEDGEGSERYFSFMNALAGVTRHMSRFHRRQAIVEVAYAHDNLEAYANVSRYRSWELGTQCHEAWSKLESPLRTSSSGLRKKGITCVA